MFAAVGNKRWPVSRRHTAHNCGLWRNGKGYSRNITGYAVTSHDGVERFIEGNREALKESLSLIASNYGLKFTGLH